MHVLLFDNHGRLDAWPDRAPFSNIETTTVRNEEELVGALKQSRFMMAICSWKAIETVVDETLVHLKSQCKSVLCMVDRDDTQANQSAYVVGFEDCLFADSSDEEIDAKLKRTQHLEVVNTRLAQAQKLESIGELASGIAHEINTPIQYVGDNTRFVQSACDDLLEILNSCQTFINTVDSEGDVNSATEKLRGSIEEADLEYLVEEIPSAIGQTLEGIDRVTNIVRAMKEFAHPGGAEMTQTDISQSIENTIMVARNEWKYVAEMVTDFDDELGPVPCFPGELNQVLLNMIVNAAHAIAGNNGETPEQKGKITIATRLAAPFAEIRISDSGVGIAKENIERIFAPFFTTKAAGKGTGQGLAIAQSVIVEKHGGTIGIESEPNVGTTFIIRIPLVPATNNEADPIESMVDT